MSGNKINYITIVISLGTSIFISLLTFILGLKAGKNQTDRQIFKNHYRELYIYFKKLQEGINYNIPKSWEDFGHEHINKKYSYVATPLKKKERTGELVELEYRLINKLDLEEKKVLRYGYLFKQEMLYIKSIIVTFIEKNFDLSNYKNDSLRERNFYINKRPPGNTPYVSIPFEPDIFLDQKNIDEALQRAEQNNSPHKYINIKIPLKNNENTLYIELSLIKNFKELLNNIYDTITNDEKIITLKKERNIRLKRLKKLTKKIVKRVQEPHTFFNTIINSFFDIFKN